MTILLERTVREVLPPLELTVGHTLPPLPPLTTLTPTVAPPRPAPRPTPAWVPLLLAGDPDDDGSEPHICRGID
ncbi:hypothetical protein ABZ532_05365 [Streptomyces sp. NPDC019396]|uniref:hypothetical protein n=1 Tax=Streptomyces sp. NPDC019396 TaxID=3154687 RepID=UPI0033D7AA3B